MSDVNDFHSRLTNTSINKSATQRIDHDLKMAGYGNLKAKDLLVQKGNHLELNMSTTQGVGYGNKALAILNESLRRETGGKAFDHVRVRKGFDNQISTQQPMAVQPMPMSPQIENTAIQPSPSNLGLVSPTEQVSTPHMPVSDVGGNEYGLSTRRGNTMIGADMVAQPKDAFSQNNQPPSYSTSSEHLHQIQEQLNSPSVPQPSVQPDISTPQSIEDLVNGINNE